MNRFAHINRRMVVFFAVPCALCVSSVRAQPTDIEGRWDGRLGGNGLGDRVRRGQLLGLLGNSGDSTGPHLHFHIADGNSPLASEGLPYVIDAWELMREPAVWERRTNEIPMLNARVRFPLN